MFNDHRLAIRLCNRQIAYTTSRIDYGHYSTTAQESTIINLDMTDYHRACAGMPPLVIYKIIVMNYSLASPMS